MQEAQIDGSVKRILVQFSFGNRKRVPAWLAEDERETADERVHRKTAFQPGIQIIAPTKRINVWDLRAELEAAGFRIVDAVAKPRRDADKPSKTYFMARFTFVRGEPTGNAYWLDMLRTQIPDAFDGLCEDCWRVRAYRNTLADGETMLSINLEFCEGSLPEQLHAGKLLIENEILQIAAR